MVGTENGRYTRPMIGHGRCVFSAAQWYIILSKSDMSLFSNQRNEWIFYTFLSRGLDFSDVTRASWRLKLPTTLLPFQSNVPTNNINHIKYPYHSSLGGDWWVAIFNGQWSRMFTHAMTISCNHRGPLTFGGGCPVRPFETFYIVIALGHQCSSQLQ